jgi:CheY-specific phosphatase CheX
MVEESYFLDLANILSKATTEVFEKLVKSKLTTGEASFKVGKDIKGEVSSIIGLTGIRKDEQNQLNDFKAVFVLTWPLEAYIKASNLMLKEQYNAYNYEISDVGGEICNVIMENVKEQFEKLGFEANLAIPSVIHGSHHRIHYPLGSTLVTVPLSGAIGDILLEFGYAENKNSEPRSKKT